MLKLLDMFSGIGGFSLGLERSGIFTTVGFVEINKFCQKILHKHWPGIRVDGDVTERKFLPGEADVICAGFPCQDISNAGLRAGITGSHSGLWREVVRAICMVQPKYAILENVAAILGRGVDRVFGDLAEIRYNAEWDCIPASFVGAPHQRNRWFCIAYPHGVRMPGLVQGVNIGQDGQWWPSCEAYMFSGDPFEQHDMWPQPLIRRMDDGIQNRVDRITALGNSVVPQVIELIGNTIKKSEHSQ